MYKLVFDKTDKALMTYHFFTLYKGDDKLCQFYSLRNHIFISIESLVNMYIPHSNCYHALDDMVSGFDYHIDDNYYHYPILPEHASDEKLVNMCVKIYDSVILELRNVNSALTFMLERIHE